MDEQQQATPPTPAEIMGSISKGTQHLPPRIVVYGIHGIGKSTLGAAAPNAIFIPTEDGAGEIDVPKFPVATSTDDVLRQLRALYVNKDHGYRTVVIDSADWLEDYIHIELKASYTEKELSFGKDSVRAAEKASEILTALNHLRVRRGMASILIAHSDIRRFDSPMSEPYDRYVPKLQKAFGSLLQEWADLVAFCAYDVVVKKEEVGFNKEVRRGLSTGDRKLYTEERPAFIAKNRYRMPVELPMNWSEIEKHIPYYAMKEGAGANVQ